MKKKMILKRISTLLCAMIIGIGALVGSSLFYAMPSGYEDYKNYVLLRHIYYSSSGEKYVDTIVLVSNNEFYYKSWSSGEIYALGGVQGYYITASAYESGWTPFRSISTFTIGETSPNSYTIFGSNCPIYLDSSCTDVALPPMDGSSDSYNKELGYLKNVSDKKQVLTDASGVQDLSTMRKVVSFDSTSTTGVDLTTGDYVIRIYGQMAFVKNGTNEIVNEDFPLVHYADYSASDCRIAYNYQELFDLVTESAENPYNAFDTLFGQITRSDNVYFQIYNKTTGEYGGYVKSYLGMTSNMGEQSLYTTVDDELNVDDTGYVDYDAPSSVGSGTTWEDAELDDEYIGSSNDDLKDFESTLNIFTSTLGSVPKAIGVVFSFLPSWCLGIIALSFASFGVIAVVKFLRG